MHIVTERKPRQMIALSLITCNEFPVLGAMNNFVIRERRNATTASRFKKRKKSESRLTVGKSKVQKGFTGLFQSPTHSVRLLDNKERSAKSFICTVDAAQTMAPRCYFSHHQRKRRSSRDGDLSPVMWQLHLLS